MNDCTTTRSLRDSRRSRPAASSSRVSARNTPSEKALSGCFSTHGRPSSRTISSVCVLLPTTIVGGIARSSRFASSTK